MAERFSAATVTSLAAALLVVKVAAWWVLVKDGAPLSSLLALLTGLWPDLLIFAGVFALARALRTSRLVLLPFVVALALAVYGALSWGSFLVTQTWLTWQRLRGDENVSVGDLKVLDAHYAIPLVVVVTLVFAVFFVGAIFGKRTSRVVASWRPLVVALLSCALLFGLDFLAAPLGFFALSEQPVFELARSAFAKPRSDKEPLSDDEWKRVHKPLARYDEGAAPRAPQGVKNVILYLAEGISTEHTSFGAVDSTPNLLRRFNEHGLLFERYYTHTHRSIHAIFSTVCSQYPPPTLDAMSALHPRIDCASLMEQLSAVPKMHQGLFHGGRFSFANKLALLGGRGFDVTQDAGNLEGGRWASTWWGVDDRAVADAALAFVDEVPRDEPFFLLIIPIAPHEPYDVPRDAKLPKRIKGASKKSAKFLRAVRFSDVAFERLMKGLEARDRYNDTLTIYAPDHGNFADEPARPTRGKRVLYEHNVHVPLVFLHPGSYSGERTRRIGAQIDLAPTIVARFGARPDAKNRGQDLFSSSYERRRIYLLKTRGNTPFVGVVDGDKKFIYETDARRYEYYDLSEDPEELSDLSSSHLTQMRIYAKDGAELRGAQRKTLLSMPALKETSDAEFLATAKATCGGEVCPKGVSVKAGKCKGRWAQAPCLRTSLKAGVPVDIALTSKIIGRHDSIRVRWWLVERKKIKRAKLTLVVDDREIPANPPWRSNDVHRVLPLPTTGAPKSIVVRIEPAVDMEPVLEFVEH